MMMKHRKLYNNNYYYLVMISDKLFGDLPEDRRIAAIWALLLSAQREDLNIDLSVEVPPELQGSREDPTYQKLVSAVEDEAGHQFAIVPYMGTDSKLREAAQACPFDAVPKIWVGTGPQDIKKGSAIVHELRHVLQGQHNPRGILDSCMEFYEGWAEFSRMNWYIHTMRRVISKAELDPAIDNLHKGNDSEEYRRALARTTINPYPGERHPELEEPQLLGYIGFRAMAQAYGEDYVKELAMTAAPDREEFEGMYRQACQTLGYQSLLDLEWKPPTRSPGLLIMGDYSKLE